MVIEGNSTAAVGSPVEIPVDEGVVIIVHPISTNEAFFKISYQVVGEKYPWYEKPYLGK